MFRFTAARAPAPAPEASVRSLQFSTSGSHLFARYTHPDREFVVDESVVFADDDVLLDQVWRGDDLAPLELQPRAPDDSAEGPFFVTCSGQTINLRTLAAGPEIPLRGGELAMLALDQKREQIAVLQSHDSVSNLLLIRSLVARGSKACAQVNSFPMHVEFDASGQRLIVDGEVYRSDGEPLRTSWSSVLRPRDNPHIAFSHDDSILFMASRRGLSRWDATTGAFLGEWQEDAVVKVARGSDSQMLFVTEKQHALWRWDMAHNVPVKVADLRLAEGERIDALACAGHRVALGTNHGEIMLAELRVDRDQRS